MGEKFAFVSVLDFFFLFSTQNQVPQILIGMCRGIFKFNALLEVIWRTVENSQKIANVEKKPYKISEI